MDYNHAIQDTGEAVDAAGVAILSLSLEVELTGRWPWQGPPLD